MGPGTGIAELNENTVLLLLTLQSQHSNMMRLLLVQVTSLLATHFLWFGAILPCLWKDRGFPAILQLFNVNHLKTSTFDTDLPISSFALAASFLHTAIVLLGIGVGTLVRRFQDSNRTKASTVHAFCVGLCMGICTSGLLYFVSFHLFQTSFIGNWQGGFQYAMYFFKETVGGADFAHVAAMSLTIECTTAYLIRVCTKQYNGVFPKFAENIIPKSLFSFVVCYGTFRKLLTPHVVKSLAAATGMFSKENIAESGGVSLPHLKLDEWAALAACVHTLCIALGMTFHALTKDVIGSMTSQACRTTLTQRTNGLLRFIVFFVGATAFFTTIQWWLSHGYALEFVQKSTIMQGGFFQHKETGDGGGSSPSQASVAVAGGFYTLAFLMGAVISENPLKLLKNQKCTQTMNQKCTQCVTRNLRLRPAPTFKRATKVGDGTNTNSGVTEGLLLTGTAVLLAMYVADHQLLGVTIVHYLELTKDFLNTTVMKTIPQLLPNVWHYLHDRFSRDELFFMTLPVLLISEIPLVLFTVLDYLKLKYFDQWRIHYSKIDRKRPRTYPTNPELWKAFKVHCVNFFGIYCSVFIVGVGFACKTNIIPYSFAKTLPKYWVLEFLFCSFFADVLFYVLHRAVHSKGLYQRLHKMHHEWIYTMALAHHYMDPLEGETPQKWFLSWVAVGGSGLWVVLMLCFSVVFFCCIFLLCFSALALQQQFSCCPPSYHRC